MWETIRSLVRDGATVLLTTQYLEEADRLADDIVVLDRGRVAARGTPADLKRLVGGKVVTATVRSTDLDRISRHPDEKQTATVGMARVAYATADAGEAAAVVSQLLSDDVEIADLDADMIDAGDAEPHYLRSSLPRRSGNSARSPAVEAGQMPRSVISAVTSRAGVTSKA